MPKLSIITINRNNAAGLRKTLESVAQQVMQSDGPSPVRTDGAQRNENALFEHIIIDGASTDESVEIIKAYANKVSQYDEAKTYPVRWISEPDKGIYNAMNKGICIAQGDYIQILNSGDMLAAPDVTQTMLAALQKQQDICQQEGRGDVAILYGNMIKKNFPTNCIIGKSGYTEYSLRQFYSSTLNHDCAYIRRSLFDEYGLYDESLKIVSDWKWYLQAIGLGKAKPVYVDIDVTIFDASGISESNLELRQNERRQVLEAVMPPAVLWDYDHHAFDAEQMNRLRRHHLYPLVYFMERVLFKLEKWGLLKR